MVNKKLLQYFQMIAKSIMMERGQKVGKNLSTASRIYGIKSMDPVSLSCNRHRLYLGGMKRNRASYNNLTRKKSMEILARGITGIKVDAADLETYVQILVQAGMEQPIAIKVVLKALNRYAVSQRPKKKLAMAVKIPVLAGPGLSTPDFGMREFIPIQPPTKSNIKARIVSGGDIQIAHQALVAHTGIKHFLSEENPAIDIEKVCNENELSIVELPTLTVEDVYLTLAKKHYPKFKHCAVKDIEVTKEAFVLNKNNLDNYFSLNFDANLKADSFVLALYGLHKSLSDKWNKSSGCDKEKADKLYNFLYYNYENRRGTLRNIDDAAAKFAPNLYKKKEYKPVEFAVISGQNEFKEMEGLHKHFCNELHTQAAMQCRLKHFVEEQVLPKVENKKWHWSQVRAAMVACGLFTNAKEGQLARFVIGELPFAKAILQFFPEDKKVEAKVLREKVNSAKYRECDSDKHSELYHAVKECIKELYRYQLDLTDAYLRNCS